MKTRHWVVSGAALSFLLASGPACNKTAVSLGGGGSGGAVVTASSVANGSTTATGVGSTVQSGSTTNGTSNNATSNNATSNNATSNNATNATATGTTVSATTAVGSTTVTSTHAAAVTATSTTGNTASATSSTSTGGGMTGCKGAVQCLQSCGTAACQQACIQNTTPSGQNLLQQLGQCLETQCPSMNGGVCDSTAANYNATNCQSCESSAVNGACSSQVSACENDTTGSSTSATTTSAATTGATTTSATTTSATTTTGTGGGMTGCNGAVSCVSNCTTQACAQACYQNATPQGQMLFQSLIQCLQGACPGTAGSVCDPAAPDPTPCQNCYNSAQQAGGACGNQTSACAANTP